MGNIEFTPAQTKMTADDLDQVRRYVKKGLSLPTTLDGVITEFKGSVEDSGITAPDLLNTFIYVNSHASEWAPLETEMIKTAETLKRFASDLKEYTEPAIDEIKTIKGYTDYTFKTKDLPVEQIRNFKVPVSDDSYVDTTYPTIDEFTTAIVESIEQKQKEATAIKHLLLNFDRKLTVISEDVGAKAAKALGSSTLEELRNLTAELISIDNQIIEVSKAQEMSATQWIVFVFCPLWAFAKFIAQQPRSNKHWKLIPQALALREKIAALQKTASILTEIQSEMRSLKIFTNDAIEGMRQIETVWAVTLEEIIASKNLLSSPKDYSLLRIFVIKMTTVLGRWEKIERHMNDLTNSYGS